MSDLTSLAGSINKMSSSLSNLGIDVRALQVTGAAFQAIGGSGQIIKGIIAAKQAYNAIRLAEGTAHLAKYTIGVDLGGRRIIKKKDVQLRLRKREK